MQLLLSKISIFLTFPAELSFYMGLNALCHIQDNLLFDRLCCFDKYLSGFPMVGSQSLWPTATWIFSREPLLAALRKFSLTGFIYRVNSLAASVGFCSKTNWCWIQKNYLMWEVMYAASIFHYHWLIKKQLSANGLTG